MKIELSKEELSEIIECLELHKYYFTFENDTQKNVFKKLKEILQKEE